DPASPLASYDYALRLVAGRYRALLARHFARLGVGHPAGTLAAGETGEPGIAAIRLDTGQRIEADLYLDCGGPSAPLLSRLGGEVEDWRGFLPECRARIGDAAGAPGAV